MNKKAWMVGILAAFVMTLATIIPTQLPAQDIDDAIGGLEKDFSFGGKEEVKRSNVAAANEQNREDVQIQLDQDARQTLTITWSASLNSHITVNSITGLGQTIAINSNEDVPAGMGTDTATFIWTIPITAGLMFPINVSVTCRGPGSCNVSGSLSGTVNGVAISCTTATTGLFSPLTTVNASSTCTTT